jgi:hypothetical protein
METTRYLVSTIAKFTTGMELGHDEFKGTDFF